MISLVWRIITTHYLWYSYIGIDGELIEYTYWINWWDYIYQNMIDETICNKIYPTDRNINGIMLSTIRHMKWNQRKEKDI